LCNDNLSGIAIATTLAQWVSSEPRFYTYRFLFAPATIGSITWLSKNFEQARRIEYGLALASLGDSGGLTYKRSRRGHTEIDRAVEHTLETCSAASTIEDFSPYGYDERQYSSPGFDLAAGCLSRSMYGRIPEYHTSADNLDFVKPNCPRLSTSAGK
jgi:aminopeptidase-like protein